MIRPLAVSCLLASVASAGDPPLQLYGLSDKGHVSVGGTRLETLPGGFDPTDFDAPNGAERWSRMAVEDGDRYLLRIDGLVERNGVTLYELPFEVEKLTPIWRELDVLDGTVAALRTDGVLAIDGVEIADHEDEKGQVFTDLQLVDMGGATPAAFCLRNDGAVFRDDEATPLFMLQEPDSTFGFADGKSSDTQWLQLTYQAGSGLVLALRADGRVRSLDPAGPPPPPPPGDEEDELPPEAGEAVVSFPFVTKKKKTKFGQRHLFFDIECTDSDLIRAARNDGRLFGSEDPETIVVDLPGRGNKVARRYLDLLVVGEEHYVLRRDGAVFSGTDDRALLRVGPRAVLLAGSAVAPDLTAADPHAPQLGRVHARVVTGEAVELPLFVADVDTPADELAVSVDLGELPGASFDADALVVTWPTAGEPGVYDVPVTVDDGLAVVKRTQRIRVVPIHDAPGNKAPLRASYQPVPVLVGVPVALPVLVADRDGDALTVELVGGDVFEAGATYDPDAGTLNWTPGLGDVGSTSARFTVSDGETTRKLKVRFDVRAALVDVESGP